jgi:anaerobic magnesium-protoporphyrin IX monomethyl ester cyclase
MKFSLISAGPNEGIDTREGRKSIAAFPPLSLAYLAAVLEEEDVEVSILDQPAHGLSNDEAARWVEKERPDVVGFSTLASSGRTAAEISAKVKEENPDVVTVFGNHHATFNAERILKKYPAVDIVARGEGERTVVQLASCLKNGEDLKTVQGINYRNGGEVAATPNQPLIKDLDTIPFPDRNLIGAEYHCLMAGANVAPKKFTSIVTSRGCAYSCRFCSCTEFVRNRWRARSAENTLEEMCLLASEGYKQLIFVDDNFTLNPKRAIAICRGMQREKLDMEWIAEGRVDNFSYELAREMVKAGLRILYFGIESANQRILNYYRKTITPVQAETAIRTAKKAGVDVIVGSFIVGAPDETRQEIENTINFAVRNRIDIPQFNILGAHPGNDIWNEFEAKGLLNADEHWEGGIAVAEICPTAVPLEEIKKMTHNAFRRHISRPSFIVEQLAKTLRSGYLRNVMLSNIARIAEIREGANSVT